MRACQTAGPAGDGAVPEKGRGSANRTAPACTATTCGAAPSSVSSTRPSIPSGSTAPASPPGAPQIQSWASFSVPSTTNDAPSGPKSSPQAVASSRRPDPAPRPGSQTRPACMGRTAAGPDPGLRPNARARKWRGSYRRPHENCPGSCSNARTGSPTYRATIDCWIRASQRSHSRRAGS